MRPALAGGALGADPLLLGGAVALGLGLAGLLSVVLTGAGGGKSASARRLEAYFSGGNGAAGARAADLSASTSLRDSAVALTDRIVSADLETKIAQRLAGAGSALTASEWILLHAAITVAAAILGLVLGGGSMMVLLFLVGLLLPWLHLKRRLTRRIADFHEQMAESLTLIAGGLSAGLSMPQAIDTVVREGQEPIAGELRRALVEQRLGVPVEEALESVAERMESQDFAWVVMAMRIQREVGGNLAELLNTVAETLREREYLRRQVKVLSAEGRFSAWVLSGLPVLLFLYMWFFKHDVVEPMTSGTGLLLLGVAGAMLVFGGFVLSRLVKIEV